MLLRLKLHSFVEYYDNMKKLCTDTKFKYARQYLFKIPKNSKSYSGYFFLPHLVYTYTRVTDNVQQTLKEHPASWNGQSCICFGHSARCASSWKCTLTDRSYSTKKQLYSILYFVRHVNALFNSRKHYCFFFCLRDNNVFVNNIYVHETQALRY